MKRYTVFFVLCLVFVLSAGGVFAQPGHGQHGHPQQGHGQQAPGGQFGYGFSGHQGQFGYGFQGQLQTVTTAQAKTYGHKVPVVITGNLIQFYGGKDLYIFRDSSGDILVKIGPKEWQNMWYQGVNITPSDTIEIYGEVHWPRHNWGTPEVHARFIKKL